MCTYCEPWHGHQEPVPTLISQSSPEGPGVEVRKEGDNITREERRKGGQLPVLLSRTMVPIRGDFAHPTPGGTYGMPGLISDDEDLENGR